MRALSNLVYLSDEIRLEVGRRFASIIADVLKRFHNDSTVFSMSLRVVGNLSLCDDNTPLLVQHGVLAQLVTGEYRCVVFVCDLIEWSGQFPARLNWVLCLPYLRVHTYTLHTCCDAKRLGQMRFPCGRTCGQQGASNGGIDVVAGSEEPSVLARIDTG